MTYNAPLLALSLVGALLLAPSARAADTRACDTAYEQAQTLRDAKKLIPARDQLRACASASCPGFMVRDCTSWLNEIETRIPSVVLVASDATGALLPNVTASMDGAAPALPVDGTSLEVDPGQHRFVFTTADGRTLEKSIVVPEGGKSQRVAVTFAIEPTTVAAPPPAVTPRADTGRGRRVAGIVVGSAGVVGVVVGAIFGGFTISSWSSVNNLCRTHAGCSSAAIADHDDAVTYGTVSDVGFIAGGVLVAGGLALYFTAPKPDSPTVGLAFTPGGVAMTGGF